MKKNKVYLQITNPNIYEISKTKEKILRSVANFWVTVDYVALFLYASDENFEARKASSRPSPSPTCLASWSKAQCLDFGALLPLP